MFKNQNNSNGLIEHDSAVVVRQRPAVLFGSTGVDGCEMAFCKILENSIDEARDGFGTVITVTVYQDKTIEIEDRGRGIPLGWIECEQTYGWDLVFCKLFKGSGVHPTKSTKYDFSINLKGIWACATQCSSEFMEVISYHNGKASSIKFKKGHADSELKTEPLAENEIGKTGTVIRWKFDTEIFTSTDIPAEFFSTVLLHSAVVNPGISFTLNLQNEDVGFTSTEYIYPRGAFDYVLKTVGETALTSPVHIKTEAVGQAKNGNGEYTLNINVSFAFSSSVNSMEFYHNDRFLEYGGSPKEAAAKAFLSVFKTYLKKNFPESISDTDLLFEDIAPCLVLVAESHAPEFEISYASSEHKALDSKFLQKTVFDFMKKELGNYLKSAPAEAEKIAERILINKRAREQNL